MFRSRARTTKNRRHSVICSAPPNDLFDYLQSPTRRVGRPHKHDPANWTVADDWPERVPVSEAEIDIYEAWFGDLFDRIFGPCR